MDAIIILLIKGLDALLRRGGPVAIIQYVKQTFLPGRSIS